MSERLDFSAYARAISAMRRTETKACEVCGTAFTGYRTRRFCSQRCQMRAYRKSRKSAPPTTGAREGEG